MIANNIKDEIVVDLKDAIAKVLDYVKTALNIALLIIAGDNSYLMVGSYYRKGGEQRDYYKMY